MTIKNIYLSHDFLFLLKNFEKAWKKVSPWENGKVNEIFNKL